MAELSEMERKLDAKLAASEAKLMKLAAGCNDVNLQLCKIATVSSSLTPAKTHEAKKECRHLTDSQQSSRDEEATK